jgi:hypothetical protein
MGHAQAPEDHPRRDARLRRSRSPDLLLGLSLQPLDGDLRADRSRRDGIAKRERRGNGGNGFRALADTLNRDVAVVHKAAKNALVDP